MGSVDLRHVSKQFGDNTVLKDFNETFGDGEFITLLGPSGCGKTTMLRIIAGFEKPSVGEVWLDGKLVSGGRTFVPPEKRGIGMVFQSYAVWPHMNVFENVAYPLKIQKKSREEIRKDVERALQIVHLSQYAQRLPNQLSGGQQQRVALARALVSEPGLLLLDEPLSNLDAKLRETMRFEIKEIQKKLGLTVVYVTHDQTEAMAMSDRIFLINKGEVQQSGSPEEIYNRPRTPFAADFLGKVDFFRGTAGNGSVALEGMKGQKVECGAEWSGGVIAAVRPENIQFCENGPLEGTLETQYYLGDTDDCRVRVGDVLVRVIAPGYMYRQLKAGETVRLSVRDLMIFNDDGSLEEGLRIRT